jgi:capsular polysaccharide biosynthesis protein
MEVTMELELRDIFRIIWARIWIIVLITIVAMLASGIISCFYLDKIYESSTTLIVNKQKDDNEKETQYTYNDILLSQKLVSTYTEIAKSSYVLERVIKELNLDLSPDELKKMIAVSAVGDTQIIRITVSDVFPARATVIAEKMAELLPIRVSELEMPDNVKVVDKAKVPSSPVKPRPLMNIAIAGVLGIMVGLGIIFLIEYLDNTIKTPDDVQKYLGLPVLGSIPNFED